MMKNRTKKNYLVGLMLIQMMLICGYGYAQNFPYGINYQAVARDANGNAKANQVVNLRFSINKTSSNGTLIWQETNVTTTNNLGQFNLVIGSGITTAKGTATSFAAIDWTADMHFMSVEILNGNIYQSIGSPQQLQSVPYALAAPDATPVGTVVAYMGNIPPTGWLMCDGTAVNRISYSKLYAVLGNSCGYGDNSNTFNLPDFRGMFLRGVDGAAGNDPDKTSRTAQNPGGNIGNAIGSQESDDFKSHVHMEQAAIWPNAGSYFSANASGSTGSGNTNVMNTLPAGGNETRPKNIYVNYIIKY